MQKSPELLLIIISFLGHPDKSWYVTEQNISTASNWRWNKEVCLNVWNESKSAGLIARGSVCTTEWISNPCTSGWRRHKLAIFLSRWQKGMSLHEGIGQSYHMNTKRQSKQQLSRIQYIAGQWAQTSTILASNVPNKFIRFHRNEIYWYLSQSTSNGQTE